MTVSDMVTFTAIVVLVSVMIIGLYMLIPPKRRLAIPSIIIWQRFVKKIKSKFDRKKWFFSVLLALLIASILTVVLLSDRYGELIGIKNRLVLLIDNSPSMSTKTSDGGTRYAKALVLAKNIIDELDINAQVMIVDTQGSINSPRFDLPKDAIQLVNDLRIGIDPLGSLSSDSIYDSLPRGERYVVTDGVSMRKLDSSWNVISVFEEAENVGITQFRVDTVPGEPERQKAFLTLQNFGKKKHEVELKIKGVGSPELVETIEINPSQAKSRIYDISQFGEGPITARIVSGRDSLDLDDAAYSFRNSTKQLRIGLVSKTTKYFASLLENYPGAKVKQFDPFNFKYQGNIDFYVFDDVFPEKAPVVPALFVNSKGANWLPNGPKIENPTFKVDARGHPIFNQVLWEDIFIDSATLGSPIEPHQESLVGLNNKASVLILNNLHPRWVWMGFNLNDSNFGLHPSFPVFLDNVIHWLVEETVVTQMGLGPVEVDFSGETVLGADGAIIPITANLMGQTQFFAGKSGIYTIKNSNDRLKIIINGISYELSNVNSSWLSADESEWALQKKGLVSNFRNHAVLFLLLICLVLLIFEWYTYNYRKTV